MFQPEEEEVSGGWKKVGASLPEDEAHLGSETSCFF